MVCSWIDKGLDLGTALSERVGKLLHVGQRAESIDGAIMSLHGRFDLVYHSHEARLGVLRVVELVGRVAGRSVKDHRRLDLPGQRGKPERMDSSPTVAA